MGGCFSSNAVGTWNDIKRLTWKSVCLSQEVTTWFSSRTLIKNTCPNPTKDALLTTEKAFWCDHPGLALNLTENLWGELKSPQNRTWSIRRDSKNRSNLRCFLLFISLISEKTLCYIIFCFLLRHFLIFFDNNSGTCCIYILEYCRKNVEKLPAQWSATVTVN